MEHMNADAKHFQHTIKNEVVVSGVGIHTGTSVTLTLKPAEPNTGINFQRTDLPGKPVVKADVDNVIETNRSTTIEAAGARISTIEHLLAALVGMEVDNLLIEIDGPEVPILDGSAQPFVEALEKAGTQKQDAEKIFYSIDENITFTDEDKKVEMVALPYHSFRINTLIDFNSPVLGTQHATIKNITEFNKEVAPSRTFCFFHELELLLDNNLIKGGDINNAIVIVDKPVSEQQINKISKAFNKIDLHVSHDGTILNNIQLRFPDEPARHKLLDMIGDLALVGYAFNAHIIANRPGHSANIKFAKKIKDHIKKNISTSEIPKYDPLLPPVMDIQKIENTLPHRYPFLMVDKVVEISDKHIVAIKNVTYNEPFFQGHFPGNCVMPGVLMVEALAQTGGLLVIPRDSKDKYDTYFLKIENFKFKQKVVPGDTLILKMEILHPVRRGISTMKGSVYVGDKVVAEGILVAQIVKQ
jgi:UDP-3-O-[3-hydroxymyristoyl] N-acetylglucosamine deacetylase / 3-hydroxyacyl-[acyl-carrier-protein] dehydratase